MDHKLQNQEIRRLIELGEVARSGVAREASSLKSRLDFPERLRGSIVSHPSAWLLGSLAAGLAISQLFGNKSRDPSPLTKKRSLPLVVLGLTLTAVKPFAKVWLADQVRSYLAGQLGRPAGNRPRNQPPY